MSVKFPPNNNPVVIISQPDIFVFSSIIILCIFKYISAKKRKNERNNDIYKTHYSDRYPYSGKEHYISDKSRNYSGKSKNKRKKQINKNDKGFVAAVSEKTGNQKIDTDEHKTEAYPCDGESYRFRNCHFDKIAKHTEDYC